MSRANEPNQPNPGMTEQMGQQARDIGNQARDMGNQAREAAREQYDRLRHTAEDYYEQGRQRAMEWEQGLENYVQEQPIKALAIAAGVGLLVGILWKRS